MRSAAAPAARLAGFVAELRRHAFPLGPGESELALSLLASCDLADTTTARLVLKTVLSGSREEWARFDDLFDAYWFGRRGRRREESVDAEPPRPAIWDWRAPAGAAALAPGEAPAAGSSAVRQATATLRLAASPSESRAAADLRTLTTPEDMAEAERIAIRLARAMRRRLVRRLHAVRRGRRIDLRRTIRCNLARGGEPIELRLRRRRERPAKLVALLDVSGSMKPYSRFFLAFLRGLVGALRTDAFLFHTRLVPVGAALREPDPQRALARLSPIASGFGGGTRIAASLKAFNDRHATRSLGARAIAIVISDGYDTDPPALLVAELARLKRRARRLVWLNPLLGAADYAPAGRAMTAALAFIDCFAAAHSTASLAALEDEFARL